MNPIVINIKENNNIIIVNRFRRSFVELHGRMQDVFFSFAISLLTLSWMLLEIYITYLHYKFINQTAENLPAFPPHNKGCEHKMPPDDASEMRNTC